MEKAPEETTKPEHITIPELVKKLIVLPEKRTEDDCKLMADALYVFISSIAAFKEGSLISSHHTNMASLIYEQNISRIS